MQKVLITDNIHPFLQEQLENNHFQVDVSINITKNELLKSIQNYSILVITTYLKIDQEIINHAKHLKIIARVGSGLENVDVAYATKKGIIVINSPEGNANAVAEHALGMLLNLLNNINTANSALKQNSWNREIFRGEELDGKTIGIIGYGHTGSAFAKKLKGFDVQLLVNDILPNKHENQCSLKDIQRNCDIISTHVPYNPTTHHLMNKKFIDDCIKKPILINTSRGAVIHTTDVLQALTNQTIRGLCIDVFEDEPISKNNIHDIKIYEKLIHLDNVIATPHIAGWTIESKYKLVKILWDKIQIHLKELC